MAGSRSEQLLQRVRAMHTLWNQVTTDLTLDQVNHHEREGVLPIAFSLHHYVVAADRAISWRLFDQPTLWEQDDWEDRVGATVPSVTRGTPISVAETLRFGNYEAWLDYQGAVFARSEQALADLSDERWDEVVFERMPDQLRGGFLHLVAGDGPVYLGDLLDAFVFQHGIRHLGEIEHARALIGLQGVG